MNSNIINRARNSFGLLIVFCYLTTANGQKSIFIENFDKKNDVGYLLLDDLIIQEIQANSFVINSMYNQRTLKLYVNGFKSVVFKPVDTDTIKLERSPNMLEPVYLRDDSPEKILQKILISVIDGGSFNAMGSRVEKTQIRMNSVAIYNVGHTIDLTAELPYTIRTDIKNIDISAIQIDTINEHPLRVRNYLKVNNEVVNIKDYIDFNNRQPIIRKAVPIEKLRENINKMKIERQNGVINDTIHFSNDRKKIFGHIVYDPIDFAIKHIVYSDENSSQKRLKNQDNSRTSLKFIEDSAIYKMNFQQASGLNILKNYSVFKDFHIQDNNVRTNFDYSFESNSEAIVENPTN
ncbi:hypothetical protein [Nonlabens antarcticus]|uniref:hypothetical protein n=1 Tax=Nonlabens antarcticus TaxID=392714 RepID=UPI0018919342|nr:hypothetical protein [Nonlabens antarcticus]